MELELRYSKAELEAYTKQRLEGISEKTKDWIIRANNFFWDNTQGVISYNTISKFREATLNKWKSQDSWSKVLNFAKGFLQHLAKLKLDDRFNGFLIFLEKPKKLKERRTFTDRIVTENDIKNVIRYFVKKWKAGEIDRDLALTHITQILFGAYTGQRPNTIQRLRVDQFEKALSIDPPTLLVEAQQDKIRMEHYVPLHPKIIPFIKEVLKLRKGKESMFEYGSLEKRLKKAKIPLENAELIKDPKERHFVLGDLRKFAEQIADKIKWDISNKNYILSHGVSGVEWKHYKNPQPQFVYKNYMDSWKDVDLIPEEAYELLKGEEKKKSKK